MTGQDLGVAQGLAEQPRHEARPAQDLRYRLVTIAPPHHEEIAAAPAESRATARPEEERRGGAAVTPREPSSLSRSLPASMVVGAGGGSGRSSPVE